MRQTIIAIVLFTVLFISACVPTPTYTNTNTTAQDIKAELEKQSQLKQFSSAEEVQDYLEKNRDVSSYSYNTFDAVRSVAGIAEGAMVKTAEDTASALSTADEEDYSTTNIQVSGVDEADIVKTDGTTIYVLSQNKLTIIDPKEMKALFELEYTSTPQEIYLYNNRLVVFGYDYNNQYLKRSAYPYWGNSNMIVHIYDITDKTSPVEVKNITFEGNYVSSRMIGSTLYFITQTYASYAYEEDVLPLVLENDKAVSSFPDIYYFPRPITDEQFTTVAAIDVADENRELSRQVFLLSGAQNIFMSTENLYITYTKYLSEYDLVTDITYDLVYASLNDRAKEKIAKIEATDEEVLSDAEKKQKITQIVNAYVASLDEASQEKLQEDIKTELKSRYENLADELQKTVIHKFALDGLSIEHAAQAEVPGQPINQFAMQEEDSTFMIATTKDQIWSSYLDLDEEERASQNNLYILDDNLKMISKLENLASGERIYSVRFMQDRAYMVTFKQVDPLFVIDVSNKQNPQVLGELKIPGFSTYLHPYDENTLIGIGRDTDVNQWGGTEQLGVKLSLFDVSEVSAPKEVDTVVLGGRGSDSSALYDHKAFLFSKDKNLLVIPATLREESKDYWGKVTFVGAKVFDVTPKGFTLRGGIEHIKDFNKTDYYWYGNEQVQRSLYIGDDLFTVSGLYLKKNSLSNFSVEESLTIYVEPEYEDDYPYPPKPMPLDDERVVVEGEASGGSTGSSGVVEE